MSDWFDSVTGTNDYERQSWRDSYNGGNAAGDWTGNTNARLSEERDSFQGATWSGSSSQPSALQLAQSFVGRGSGSVGTPGALSAAGGPGFGTLQTVGRPAPTSGPGRSIVVTAKPSKGGGSSPAMTPKDKQMERIGNGGPYDSDGAISDFGWANTGTGWVPVPSSDVKERIEDNFFLETSWFARNYLGPMFIGGSEERTRPPFLDPEYSHYVAPFNEWREGTWTRPGGYRTGGGF